MAALNVKLVFFFLVSYTLVVLNCVALPTKSSPTSSRSRALKGPPAYRNQIVSSHRADQGRNIQPLPCQDKKGNRGVCMFAWNCAEAGGTHLGTCVDRFYFGSCCSLPDVIKPQDMIPTNNINEIPAEPAENVAAPAVTPTTTTSTTTTTTTPENTSVDTPPPLSVTAVVNLSSKPQEDAEAVAAPVGASDDKPEPEAPVGDVQATTTEITTTEESTTTTESTTTSTTTTTTTTVTTTTTTTTVSTTTTAPSVSENTVEPEKPSHDDIWTQQEELEKVQTYLNNLTYTEACGRRPWKNVKNYQKIYPAGHKSGQGFSESPIGKQRRRNSKFLSWASDPWSSRNRGGRIVQGELADYGEWPWQISLRQWRTATYIHKCGCALLSENWAITAAHCVENVSPDDLLLRMGEYDLGSTDEPQGHIDRKVQIVASHPKFDPKTFEYDLALLRFYEPVDFQPNVIPICIPEDDQELVGETAWVTGWGRLYEEGPLPSVLQEVSLPIINNKNCEGMYRDAGYIEHIPNIFICAGYKEGGKDSCEGDSGGPMVVQREDGRFMLSGIISWGIGCAEENQPGVYTRISEFRDWILQILQF